MATRSRFFPAQDADEPCYDPRMTRAAAIALRTAGLLRENCVVVLVDGPTIGTPGNTSPTEIELNPVSPTELGLTARVHTTFDDSAWAGTYDIDLGVAGSITRLTDSSQNTVVDFDADSPTVHTQFPWHLGTLLGVGRWRDNYVEDTTIISPDDSALPHFVQDNRFVNTTVDFTGWVTGSMTDMFIRGGGTHHIAFGSIWSRSTIDGATVNAVTDNITLTGSDIVDAPTSVSTTGTGTLSISNSRIEEGAVVLNASDVSMTITTSTIKNLSQIVSDAGSLKALNINDSTVSLFTLRGQGGTVQRSVSFSGYILRGRSGVSDSITVIGDGSISAAQGEWYANSTSVIDGPTTATSLQWTGVKFLGSRITHGPLATNCQWFDCELVSCIVDIQGPGINNFCCIVRNSKLNGTLIRHSAGVTESLSIQDTFANSQTSLGVIAIDAASPRGLAVSNGCQLTGNFSIIQTGTVAQANIGNRLDTVSGCQINGGIIEWASTAAGTLPSFITECILVGGPNAPGQPDGRIRIDGNTERVNIFSNEIWGDLHLTDVPEGALDGPTSVYNNYIGATSELVYTGGDNVFKQIRDNRIEGNNSSLQCIGLTGAAGGGNADVFSGRIANQSTVVVTGARVPGFPIRNFTVENGSILNVDPSGAVLQWSQRNTATVNTGPFVHFENEISGLFTKTLTASNTNNLANKSFDDMV